GHAAALALATGQPVDPRIQLVLQIEARQRVERGLGIGRSEQRSERLPQAPLRQAAGQHRRHYTLARRQRRRLRRQEQARAQSMTLMVIERPRRLPKYTELALLGPVRAGQRVQE